MAHPTYKNKDGIKVPSTTGIIAEQSGWNKQALLNWQARMFREGKDPTKIKNEAGDTGTLCHTYIESYIYGIEVDNETKKGYNTQSIVIAESGLEQFKRIVDKLQLEFLETELPLVSEKYQYGGCLDFLYKHPEIELDGKKYPAIKCGLGDNKTSKAIYSDYYIQLGAYDNMVKECTKYVPEEFMFIKISKDITKPDDEIVKAIIVPSKKIYLGFEVFKHLRQHADIRKELESE